MPHNLLSAYPRPKRATSASYVSEVPGTYWWTTAGDGVTIGWVCGSWLAPGENIGKFIECIPAATMGADATSKAAKSETLFALVPESADAYCWVKMEVPRELMFGAIIGATGATDTLGSIPGVAAASGQAAFIPAEDMTKDAGGRYVPRPDSKEVSCADDTIAAAPDVLAVAADAPAPAMDATIPATDGTDSDDAEVATVDVAVAVDETAAVTASDTV
jgi:hypothetical protein